MNCSTNVSSHIHRVAYSYSDCHIVRYHFAQIQKQIDSNALSSVLFPNNLLPSIVGPENDFALYFDAQYKMVLLGVPKQDTVYSDLHVEWKQHGEPVRIYTNYDFFIEVKVKTFKEVSVVWGHHNNQAVTVTPVPLWGCATRDQLSVRFISLAPAMTSTLQELVDPAPHQLADFLRQRKPYIHPVIVLDYLREQSLEEVIAFFGDVSQSELSAAKDTAALAETEQARISMDLQAAQQASREDKERLSAVEARMQEKEREIQQQRTKLNTAALRIKKLEMKLAQSERMYEDLQMRLIEIEGLDGDDLDSEQGNEGNEDDATEAL